MGVVLLLVTSVLLGKEVVSQLVDTTLQQWFKQAVNTVGGIFTPDPHPQLAVLLLFRSRSFVPLSCAYHVMQVLPFNSNILSGALVEI